MTFTCEWSAGDKSQHGSGPTPSLCRISGRSASINIEHVSVRNKAKCPSGTKQGVRQRQGKVSVRDKARCPSGTRQSVRQGQGNVSASTLSAPSLRCAHELVLFKVTKSQLQRLVTVQYLCDICLSLLSASHVVGSDDYKIWWCFFQVNCKMVWCARIYDWYIIFNHDDSN